MFDMIASMTLRVHQGTVVTAVSAGSVQPMKMNADVRFKRFATKVAAQVGSKKMTLDISLGFAFIKLKACENKTICIKPLIWVIAGVVLYVLPGEF